MSRVHNLDSISNSELIISEEIHSNFDMHHESKDKPKEEDLYVYYLRKYYFPFLVRYRHMDDHFYYIYHIWTKFSVEYKK